MSAFASSTDLQNWLQLSTVNTAAAELALNVASSTIRTWCGWPISEEEDVTAVLDGTGGRTLWLPTLKLTAVSSVEVDADPLTVGTDFDWTSYGKLIRSGRWPSTPRSVEVTYTHGYEVVPDAVKGACLMVAARAYNNPEMMRSRTRIAGPFQEQATFAELDGPGLAGPEMQMLGPFRLEFVG